MVKKQSILLVVLLALVACDDKCDHTLIPPPPEEYEIIGTWYNEEYNEEIRLSESGTFYDKYSNVTHCRETEGRYEYNKETKRMTWTYSFVGETQFVDWKVTALTDILLTISSEQTGKFDYGRVVETYQMNVGETVDIQFEEAYPSYSVLSWESSNERIATVNSAGQITATGEKGTAYIKLETTESDVWVKAVVGDDCLDLWFDYVSLIGVDYKQVRNVLGVPSFNGSDGYSYGYGLNMHDLIDEVDVFLNTQTSLVEEIGLAFKPSIPESQILSYMDSHYYPFEMMGKYYYTTGPTIESSVAMVYYSKEYNCVRIVDAKVLLEPDTLWPDYAKELGASANNLGDQYGEIYYQDEDGIYFQPNDNAVVDLVAFTFNANSKEIYAVTVLVNKDADKNKVVEMLGDEYYVFEKGTTETTLAFINAPTLEEATIGITYNMEDNVVTYVYLKYKPDPDNGDDDDDVVTTDYIDYSQYLGQSASDIKSVFGAPYTEDGDYIYYFLDDGTLLLFTIKNNAVTSISFQLSNNVDSNDFVAWMNKKYYYFADWSTDDDLVFLSHSSYDESEFYVSYTNSTRFVFYTSMRSDYSTRSFATSNIVEKEISKLQLIKMKKALME